MPIRTVLDTNVLISGLLGEHSPPRQLVDAWLDGRYVLVTSLYQVEEMSHVVVYPRIASRLRLSDAEVDLILAALLSQAEVVRGDLRLPGVSRDPKDDPLVEGAADYLVSGDADLLDLGKHENTRVVTPREFVEILGI
jgi:putative PIN family toxin of toxin-antitoxin system